LVTAADGRQVRCHTPLDAEGKPQQ